MAETMTLEEAIAEMECFDGIFRDWYGSKLSKRPREALRTLLSAARRLDDGVTGWAKKSGSGTFLSVQFYAPSKSDLEHNKYENFSYVPVLIVPAEEPAGE